MKAVRLFEFGGPDRLVYGEHPMPEMGAGDALVKVLATSVSRWDVKYRTGEVHEFYGKATGHAGGIAGRKPFPMPMQLGRDVAGDVVAVGADVRGLQAGDRVIGVVHPENPQSSAAKRGLGNLSTGVDLPGHTMFGGYAQFVARPESYWIKASPALDVDQAAACMWACATAHHVVAARLGARANDNAARYRRRRRHGHRHYSAGQARRRLRDRHHALSAESRRAEETRRRLWWSIRAKPTLCRKSAPSPKAKASTARSNIPAPPN